MVDDTWVAESTPYNSDDTLTVYASEDLENWTAVFDSAKTYSEWSASSDFAEGRGNWRSYYVHNSKYIVVYSVLDGAPALHYTADAKTWYGINFPDGYRQNGPVEVHDDWFLFSATGTGGKSGVLASVDFTNWKFIEDLPQTQAEHQIDATDVRYKDGAWYIYSEKYWRVNTDVVGENAYFMDVDIFKSAAIPDAPTSWEKVNADHIADTLPFYVPGGWLTPKDGKITVTTAYYGGAAYNDDVTLHYNSDGRDAMLSNNAKMAERNLYLRGYVNDGVKQVGLYAGTPKGVGSQVLVVSTDNGATYKEITAKVKFNDTLLPKPIPPAKYSAQIAKLVTSDETKDVSLTAYNIADNNYVKIRDLAYILSGTKAEFDVGYDGATGAVTIIRNTPYTVVGGEGAPLASGDQTATISTSKFFNDYGNSVALRAYSILNNNYVKLRDIAQYLSFDVDWRDGVIWIEPEQWYTAD
jgi:hypothetical protein